MTIKVKAYQLNEKVERFTARGELKRVKMVIQSGGKAPKVKLVAEGLEPMLTLFAWKNMKKTDTADIFDLATERLLGYMDIETGIPVKYKEPEELYFKDMYQKVGE